MNKASYSTVFILKWPGPDRQTILSDSRCDHTIGISPRFPADCVQSLSERQRPSGLTFLVSMVLQQHSDWSCLPARRNATLFDMQFEVLQAHYLILVASWPPSSGSSLARKLHFLAIALQQPFNKLGSTAATKAILRFLRFSSVGLSKSCKKIYHQNYARKRKDLSE